MFHSVLDGVKAEGEEGAEERACEAIADAGLVGRGNKIRDLEQLIGRGQRTEEANLGWLYARVVCL